MWRRYQTLHRQTLVTTCNGEKSTSASYTCKLAPFPLAAQTGGMHHESGLTRSIRHRRRTLLQRNHITSTQSNSSTPLRTYPSIVFQPYSSLPPPPLTAPRHQRRIDIGSESDASAHGWSSHHPSPPMAHSYPHPHPHPGYASGTFPYGAPYTGSYAGHGMAAQWPGALPVTAKPWQPSYPHSFPTQPHAQLPAHIHHPNQLALSPHFPFPPPPPLPDEQHPSAADAAADAHRAVSRAQSRLLLLLAIVAFFAEIDTVARWVIDGWTARREEEFATWMISSGTELARMKRSLQVVGVEEEEAEVVGVGVNTRKDAWGVSTSETQDSEQETPPSPVFSPATPVDPLVIDAYQSIHAPTRIRGRELARFLCDLVLVDPASGKVRHRFERNEEDGSIRVARYAPQRWIARVKAVACEVRARLWLDEARITDAFMTTHPQRLALNDRRDACVQAARGWLHLAGRLWQQAGTSSTSQHSKGEAGLGRQRPIVWELLHSYKIDKLIISREDRKLVETTIRWAKHQNNSQDALYDMALFNSHASSMAETRRRYLLGAHRLQTAIGCLSRIHADMHREIRSKSSNELRWEVLPTEWFVSSRRGAASLPSEGVSPLQSLDLSYARQLVPLLTQLSHCWLKRDDSRAEIAAYAALEAAAFVCSEGRYLGLDDHEKDTQKDARTRNADGTGRSRPPPLSSSPSSTSTRDKPCAVALRTVLGWCGQDATTNEGSSKAASKQTDTSSNQSNTAAAQSQTPDDTTPSIEELSILAAQSRKHLTPLLSTSILSNTAYSCLLQPPSPPSSHANSNIHSDSLTAYDDAHQAYHDSMSLAGLRASSLYFWSNLDVDTRSPPRASSASAQPAISRRSQWSILEAIRLQCFRIKYGWMSRKRDMGMDDGGRNSKRVANQDGHEEGSQAWRCGEFTATRRLIQLQTDVNQAYRQLHRATSAGKLLKQQQDESSTLLMQLAADRAEEAANIEWLDSVTRRMAEATKKKKQRSQANISEKK